VPWLVAAPRCARAEKLPAGTCPPFVLAVADWIRAAAWLVMGVGLTEDLDIGDLSRKKLLGSATDERLSIAPRFVCRASAQKFSISVRLRWRAHSRLGNLRFATGRKYRGNPNEVGESCSLRLP
jgi:hypothetical protein